MTHHSSIHGVAGTTVQARGARSCVRKAAGCLLRVLLCGAAALVLIYAALELFAYFRERSARARWAEEECSIDGFLKQHPPVRENESARALQALADELGLDGNDSRTPWGQCSADFSWYLQVELAKPGPPVGPLPSGASAFLESQKAGVDAIRKLLTEGRPPTWELWDNHLRSAPRPRLVKFTSIQEILAADALAAIRRGDHAAAIADMEASWKLHEALGARPEFPCVTTDAEALRYPLGVLRRVDGAPADWVRRLHSYDPRVPLLCAHAYEACAALETSKLWPPPESAHGAGPGREIAAALAHPLVRLSSAKTAEVLLDMAMIGEGETPCAPESTARIKRMLKGVPEWSLLPILAVPDIERSWENASRLRLDLELTGQVLLARQAKAAESGNWPASLPAGKSALCPGGWWEYDRSRGRATVVFSMEHMIQTVPARGKPSLPVHFEEPLPGCAPPSEEPDRRSSPRLSPGRKRARSSGVLLASGAPPLAACGRLR